MEDNYIVGTEYGKSPLKPPSWGENIFDASEEKSPCASRNVFTKKFVGSDDCLYLNIFTKSVKPKKPYAVMVYIHGGGHYSGSSTLKTYSPDYMLLSDVIVVTINYRLGPLGFLSLKDQSLDVPGNAGMKDQQLALRFVKENIHNFGGDPDNITIFGHSSGASCAAFHCMVDGSKGLFNKAIIMSGSPVAMEALVPDKNYAFKLAEKLGFYGKSEQELLAFFEKADVLSMAEAQYSLIEVGDLLFGPTIEPYQSESSFMLTAPTGLLERAWSNAIDVVIGGTIDEGLRWKESDVNINYESVIKNLATCVDDEKLKDFAARLRVFYLSLFSSEFEAYCKYQGDFRWISMQRYIRSRQSSNGKGRTFLYRFSVDSPTQNHYRNRWIGPGSKGVVHAEELSYLWKSNQGDVPCRDSIEFISILRFTSLLTSFAITGDPNSNVLDSDLGLVVWEPIDTEPFKGLNIDQTLEFKVLEESERFLLLEAIYKEESVPLF